MSSPNPTSMDSESLDSAATRPSVEFVGTLLQTDGPPRTRATQRVSLGIHVLLAGVALLAPLFASDRLPPPAQSIRAFLVSPPAAPPPAPPPPPPVARRARRVHRPPTVEQDVPSFVAPVQVPEEIAPEDPGLGLGIEDGDGVGVEGGVPGGVVGGLVGGLADSPPPPQAVRVGGDVVAPRKIHDVGPVYPELARQAGVQGMVILECGIDERGRVTNVDVLRGVSLLNQAAIAAVKQWIYTPTLIAGRATPIVMTVTVRFALEGVR